MNEQIDDDCCFVLLQDTEVCNVYVSLEIVDYVAGIHVYDCEIQCCCSLSSDVFVLAMDEAACDGDS